MDEVDELAYWAGLEGPQLASIKREARANIRASIHP